MNLTVIHSMLWVQLFWSCILFVFCFYLPSYSICVVHVFSSVCTIRGSVDTFVWSAHAFICPACLPVRHVLCVCLRVRTVRCSRRRRSVSRTWSSSSWSVRADRMRRRRPTRNSFSGRSQTTSGALSHARCQLSVCVFYKSDLGRNVYRTISQCPILSSNP